MPTPITRFAVQGSLTALLFLATAAVAAERDAPRRITWQTNLGKATAASKAAKRPLLIKVTASWCGYCRKMKKTTFADETVVENINANFIPVTVDADENQKLMRTLHVQALPTTVIASPDMTVIKKIVGYKNANQLTSDLKAIGKRKNSVIEKTAFRQ